MQSPEYSVALSKMAEIFKLEAVTPEIDLKEHLLHHAEINRPALQLAGFFDFFSSDRLQIIGLVEHKFLENMDDGSRKAALDRVFAYRFPALVLCRGLEPMPEMLDAAKKYGIPILRTPDPTTSFEGEIIRWLKVELAPRVITHGTLVDIYGEGIFLIGESGIGKSETALELVKRGHRFVADDAVEIRKVSNQSLVGSCPEMIRYFIELRGIGIIDVKYMFGFESIKETVNIDLVIQMEAWERNKEYERFGLEDHFTEILGNRVPVHTLPIRPGRNLAVICECAAINHRQRKLGYNAAAELEARSRIGFRN